MALDEGRLVPPFDELGVRHWVGAHAAPTVAAELTRLASIGMTPALFVELLAALESDEESDRVALVWSGPEEAGSESRDTGVVLRELFRNARKRVMVVGFAVYQGTDVFQVLAERMDADPALEVT